MNTLVPILVAVAALATDVAKPTTVRPRPAAPTAAAPKAAPVDSNVVDAAPTIKLDPCTQVAADATATLLRHQQSAEVQSQGVAYHARTRKCRRFIADLHVPSDAMGPGGGMSNSSLDYAVSAAVAGPLLSDEATCIATTMSVSIYEKPAGASAFSIRARAEYKGSWTANSGFGLPCRIKRISGDEPPRDLPNPSGPEVWRVLVDANTGGTPRPVTAAVAFDIIPA